MMMIMIKRREALTFEAEEREKRKWVGSVRHCI
jgi:hypothetical protein